MTAKLRSKLRELAAKCRRHDGSLLISGRQVDAARGLDGWTGGRELRALLDEAFDELAIILNGIMEDVSWPLQVLRNQVVLLAKPKGGDRPIC